MIEKLQNILTLFFLIFTLSLSGVWRLPYYALFKRPFRIPQDEVCSFFLGSKKTVLFLLLITASTLYWGATMLGVGDGPPDGFYCYQVIVSNDQKTYTLPAGISITTDEYDDVRDDLNPLQYGTTVRSPDYVRRYHIDCAYWPNGGYLYFDQELDGFGRPTKLHDQDDRDWEVTLTQRRASHPQIKERQDTSLNIPAFIFTLFLLLTDCLALLQTILLLLKRKRSQSHGCKTLK